MANITYPPNIKTDNEKLRAVYSLIEQMRLEHNRQGAIARSDWNKHKDKWYLYALRPKRLGDNEFWKRLRPLLTERNGLRDTIRNESYTDKEWAKLSDAEKDTAYLAMYGDRQVEQEKPTDARSDLLDELKSISLDSLKGAIPPDPTEDFTAYTEVDPNSHIVIDSASMMHSNLVNAVEDAYTYYDHGAGHFGDFEWLFDTIACINKISNYWCGITGAANDLGAWYDLSKFIVACVRSTGGWLCVIQTESGYGSKTEDWWASVVEDVRYWCNLERASTTLTLKIYSDVDRTGLLDTPTVSCGTTTYRYSYGIWGWGYSSDLGQGSSDLKNLDLQEVGVTEKTSSDTGAGSDTKASYPSAMLAKSETGAGVDSLASQQAEISVSDIGADAESLLGRDIVLYETGNGLDALSLLIAALTGSDNGAGIEQSILSLLLTSSDSGSGTDALTLLLAELNRSDLGEGSDSFASLLAELAASDSGLGVDVSELLIDIIEKYSSDIGSGADALSDILAVLTGEDSGVGADSLVAVLKPSSSISLIIKLPRRNITSKLNSRNINVKSPYERP